MEESSSPYWWLNSGGSLSINQFTGGTLSGNSLVSSLWHVLYEQSNALDTDQGLHPQNIFRLLTRSEWGDSRQQAQFLILQDNFSSSPNRNASNGLLLMSRYQGDGETLYYAGVRVDGDAVIKKKYKGSYYTLAQKKVFEGSYEAPQDKKNLIPHRLWLGLRSETKEQSDGSVTISLYLRRPNTASWEKVLEAADRGQYEDTPPIVEAGYAGIRTDFMDARFENYRIENL
jgi:hypothetical protein